MNKLSTLLGLTLFDIGRNRYNRPYFKWHYHLMAAALWILFLPLFMLQLLGVFRLIDRLRFKRKLRKLTTKEIEELQLVYLDSVDYNLVRVLENSIWAKFGSRFVSSKHLGSVFLNTIHFSRAIQAEDDLNDMAWLVHEAAHISQYQKLGIVYIVKALRAQRNGGYHYQNDWLNGRLKDFNFEQQADIAKTYYLKIKNNQPTAHYEIIIDAIRMRSFC